MPRHTLPESPQFDPQAPPRSWLPAPDELADALTKSIDDGPPDQLSALTAHLGAPTTDLCVTPLTARASLMAASHGRAFYHHELRRRLAMPPALEPEISVWEAGTVPLWSDGVLAEPKYFSFFQDAPLPAYNPNHRRKWRAHELLHGASRFFWHPRMTRFEFYVSARLNELVPVIHWYHLDEMYRPRCPEHLDRVLHRDHCQKCQQIAAPYWEARTHVDLDRHRAAQRHADRAWDHFTEEWEAITAEIESGRRHPLPRPRLDASSDAVGYIRAHWNRVTAWSFGHWAETFLVDGVDYFSTLDALRENVGRALRQLVSGSVFAEPEVFFALRTRSQLQDLGYRTLLALEWLDPDGEDARRAEEVLMPELDRAADLARRLLDDRTATEEGLDQFARTCQAFSQVAPRFPDEIADAFLAFGYRFIDAEIFAGAATGQVLSGLQDAMPQTVDNLSDLLETTRRFVISETFDELGRLSERFARWLCSDEATDQRSPTLGLARFEALANAEPRTDEEATHFAVLPEHTADVRDKPGRLRPHATLRRGEFESNVLASATGSPVDATGSFALAAIVVDGDLRIIVEDDDTSAVLDHVLAGDPVEDWWDFTLKDALASLLENRFLVWLPVPRR